MAQLEESPSSPSSTSAPVHKQPSGLMRLPDELLLRIFGFVIDRLNKERIVAHYSCRPFKSSVILSFKLSRHVPGHCLLINRRLYSLLYSLWGSYLSLKSEDARHSVTYRPAARIHYLDLWDNEHYPVPYSYESIDSSHNRPPLPSYQFLSSFSRLHTLRVCFRGGIPRTFTDLLKGSTALADLTLKPNGETEDTTFTLGEAIPSLQRFALTPFFFGERLQWVTNLPLSLKELHLNDGFPDNLPWLRIPRISLCPRKGYFSDPDDLADSLAEACVTADPLSYRLEELTFRVDVVRSPEPEGDGCPEDVISELLELLQPVHSLKHLRFLGFLTFGWDPTDIRITSIETLTLHEDVREANRPYEPAPAHPHPHPHLFPSKPSLPLSPYYYQTFLDFLNIFPNLRTLYLSGYAPLKNKADEMTPIQPGSTSTFLKRHPRLDRLLKSLKDSKVVEFFYRTDYVSERELRLRREGPRKKWEGEWWNL